VCHPAAILDCHSEAKRRNLLLPLPLPLLLSCHPERSEGPLDSELELDLVLNAVILSKAKDLAVDSSVELTKRSAALDLPVKNKKSPGISPGHPPSQKTHQLKVIKL
jgi:hypothetical protein